MMIRALLLTSALLLSVTSADQSSCRVIWIFKLSCGEPAGALVNQVKAWSTKKCRDSEDKCMYELEESSPTYVKVKHTSPTTRKTNTITFEFNPPTAPSFCRVKGTSTSNSHNNTSPNDYCLFYSLMEGSGLTEAPGYREISNEAMCPSLKTAQCKK